MSRLLLVDDAPSVLSAVSAALGRAGYEVLVARDGHEAVALIDRERFDVAVIDYDIPGPDGLELLGQIALSSPRCVCILASGALDLDIAMRAVNERSVAQVLRKPYRRAELLDAVAAAVASRHAIATEDPDHRADREALADCFSGNLLSLALQPIILAETGEVAAYEALLRSTHERLRGPLEVLAAAEDNERVHELGARVAELARGWADRIPMPQRLFVNLHTLQLADPDCLMDSLDPLIPHAHRIVLEITERSRLDDIGVWRRSAARLVEAGFSLAVDDLGSGFSTMSVLAELKPAVVKVDQSIIRGIDADEHKRRLLELITQFARATDSEVVAEGIETPGESAAAIGCGPNMLQGYFYGRPSFHLVEGTFDRAVG